MTKTAELSQEEESVLERKAFLENDIRCERAMKMYKEKWLSKEEDGENQDRVPSDVKTHINCFEDVRAEVPKELPLQRREYPPSKGETVVLEEPTLPT